MPPREDDDGDDENHRIQYATVCCLCCCGGLPILALIKTALTLPICLCITVLGNITLTLVYLPINLWHSAKTIVQTPYWGRKLKALFLLFLPMASLAPLPLVVLGSLFYALVMPFAISFFGTFIPFEDEILCEQPIRVSINALQEYFEFSSKDCYRFLEDLRSPPNPGEIVPRDMPCCTLIIFILQTLAVTIIFVVFNAIVVALKYPLLLVGGYVGALSHALAVLNECTKQIDSICFCFTAVVLFPLFFAMGIVFWPVGLTMASAAAVTALPMLLALDCAVKGYRYNSVMSGFAAMTVHMHKIDADTTGALVNFYFGACLDDEVIEENDWSFICALDPANYAVKEPRQTPHPTDETSSERPNVPNPMHEGEGRRNRSQDIELGALTSRTGESKDRDSGPPVREGLSESEGGKKDVDLDAATGESEEAVTGVSEEAHSGSIPYQNEVEQIRQAVSVLGPAVKEGLWKVTAWGVSQLFGTASGNEEEKQNA